MQALDHIARQRDRINALHDAIAIIVAEIGQKDFALRDSIVRRLRAEEQKITAQYPLDERGVKHPRRLGRRTWRGPQAVCAS